MYPYKLTHSSKSHKLVFFIKKIYHKNKIDIGIAPSLQGET